MRDKRKKTCAWHSMLQSDLCCPYWSVDFWSFITNLTMWVKVKVSHNRPRWPKGFWVG